MFNILMKPVAIGSQEGEVAQFAEFPWRFFTSILSELVQYRYLILSASVFTFVIIGDLGKPS